MKFSPQSNELAGTSWVVIGYNNGRGGVVSTIIGTELTATFSPNGILSGSSGCNTYQAGYEVDGNNITIIPPLVHLITSSRNLARLPPLDSEAAGPGSALRMVVA